LDAEPLNLAAALRQDDENNASSPLEWYWHFSQRPDFQTDPAQLEIVQQLERLHGELEQYRQYRQSRFNRLLTNFGGGKPPPRGMYVWGTVGRGKSLMMDAFYSVSNLRRKRRVHFHQFMREIHASMRAHAGTQDPLAAIADDIATAQRLLCFDEFHVSDIADAMILGKLLEYLIDRGVVLVMTSNYKPEDLYPNGLQRSRFLPAIEILKTQLDVIQIGGREDHRQRVLESIPVYYSPITADTQNQLAHTFAAISRTPLNQNLGGTITIAGRAIATLARTKGVIWFEFDALCAAMLGQNDYLEISKRHHTVLISNIPQLHAKQRGDVVRRFTWLIDVFYDQNVKLVCSAQVPPEQLVLIDNVLKKPANKASSAVSENFNVAGAASSVAGGDASLMVSAEFSRTASRLREMQSKQYFSRPHASYESPNLLENADAH
jgi:cell division protein ZapE